MSINTTLLSISEDTDRFAGIIKTEVEKEIGQSGATVSVVHVPGSSDADNQVFTVTVTDPNADG